ncbi:MAG: hypothetical protein GX620_05680 [Chloroflexi bacterium]|nr:hypothetical protein [Chloroflexota bacterium]
MRGGVVRVGVLTVGDYIYWGDAEDVCGPMMIDWVKTHLTDADVELEAMVQQRYNVIRGTLIVWADEVGLDLIITLGGTDTELEDVTGEASRDIVVPLDPQIAHVVGTRGHTVIVNLPGDVPGFQEALASVAPYLVERWTVAM